MDSIRECINQCKAHLDKALSALPDDATYEQRQDAIKALNDAWGCTNDAIKGLFALDDAEDTQ